MNGQEQLTRSVVVNSGFNSIGISGIATLAKGMYLVQITDGNKLVATEKIMKQ